MISIKATSHQCTLLLIEPMCYELSINQTFSIVHKQDEILYDGIILSFHAYSNLERHERIRMSILAKWLYMCIVFAWCKLYTQCCFGFMHMVVYIKPQPYTFHDAIVWNRDALKKEDVSRLYHNACDIGFGIHTSLLMLVNHVPDDFRTTIKATKIFDADVKQFSPSRYFWRFGWNVDVIINLWFYNFSCMLLYGFVCMA